nr:MAG TPA: hypothetical protein [Caudoviricetes sp.]
MLFFNFYRIGLYISFLYRLLAKQKNKRFQLFSKSFFS